MDIKNIYYVYLHLKADTNEIFYVGKGKGVRATTLHNRNNYWKNVVTKHGFIVRYIKTVFQKKRL